MLILPEKHIYLRLITDADVARHVGFNVYPMAVPKTGASMPFLVYRRAGVSKEPNIPGLQFKPIISLQVSCWAPTYDLAHEVSYEVWKSLDGYTGTLASVTIESMRLVSEEDDYLDPIQASAQLPQAYEVRQLYQIRWSEATT